MDMSLTGYNTSTATQIAAPWNQQNKQTFSI
ncbi:hypothetical protein GGD50_004614 [Rhizobium paranaense]|uniref:Uncharacterized protein n=1 Tax=Rhizobium paranaense TaxID=1650438 RepID=A0A7W8XV88_9HYPH|nr:hypothetical protein [Rhizobium paranaense]